MNEETTVSQAAPPPSMGNVPVRKCEAGSVLPAHVLDMLRLAPDNPQFRTMVNAIVLQPVPDEAKTYEQIIDWVEFNIDPATIKHRAAASATPTAAPLRAAQPSMEVPVTYSYMEYGRCNYKVSRSGQDRYMLELADIRAAAENADGWQEFVDDCIARVREDAEEDPPDTDARDDYEHYDYESSESDHDDYEVGPLATRLREFMRQHLPDEFDRLTEHEDADDDEGEGDTD